MVLSNKWELTLDLLGYLKCFTLHMFHMRLPYIPYFIISNTIYNINGIYLPLHKVHCLVCICGHVATRSQV